MNYLELITNVAVDHTHDDRRGDQRYLVTVLGVKI